MPNDFFAPIAVVILVGVAGIAFSSAFVSGTPEQTANESLTVDYTTEVSVAQSAIEYGDSPVLTNSSGDELERGTDYAWNNTVGNVTFSNTPNTTSGETVAIEYRYRQPDETQQTTGQTLNASTTVLALAVMLLAVGYVVREVL